MGLSAVVLVCVVCVLLLGWTKTRLAVFHFSNKMMLTCHQP